jgi:hypothetical protein
MVHTQNRYVFSLGVIPGLHKPKHLDSFCWLFYLECCQGIKGIQTYHKIECYFFLLCFFVPHRFGDLIAVIKMKCTCGIGAKKLCHQCHVEGIHDETGTGSKSRMYYIPLTVLGAEENWYKKEILHNLWTCEDYLKVYYLLDSTKSEAKWKRIQKETGVNCTSIWLLLVMLMCKLTVSREVELSMGIGLQARFEVVKSNETTTPLPPQYIYIQQCQTYVQTMKSVLSQQSMSHKAIRNCAE